MALPITIRRLAGSDSLSDLQREFDHMLGRVFGNSDQPTTTTGRRSAPYAVDVHEDDNHLYFEVELPGFAKEDVEITLEDSTLTITAERKVDKTSGEDQPKRETLLSERRYTYFNRSFTLPPTVSSENVSAKLDSGVLFLTLSKKEETKPRKISVE